MSKFILNKILPLFFLAFILLCFNCDGRDSIKKNHTQVLEENNLIQEFSEQVTYIPETNLETVTDTLLSSGYKIHIKTYFNMDSSVLKTRHQDSLNLKSYYRNGLADVIISTDDNVLFSKTITKTFIRENLSKPIEGLKSFILKSIWIDENTALNGTVIAIQMEYCIPETQDCLTFKLSVKTSGEYQLKQL
ncbi:hypothetical protein [Formosa sp. S-31]|uniref:hypothetical protein n=1 Tax=Formosa sp. S-31 TaxID=2790949 RepID=UPI003EB978E8